LLKINRKSIIVFDVETTGLPDGSDYKSTCGHEILQLAIIDGTGTLLMNDFFKPVGKSSWDEAQKIHGIASEDVRDKPAISELRNTIQHHIDSAELLVAYNLRFDVMFLRAIEISFAGKYCYDVMNEFAKRHGDKGKHRLRQYVSLRKCAAYYGYDLADAHNAEADARATLHCFLKLHEEN